VKGLDRFEAQHLGPFGMIVSSWKRKGNDIEYRVTVPPNSTAELSLKGDKILESGKVLSNNTVIRLLQGANNIKLLNLKAGSYLFIIKQYDD
jgi:alpha-L-rhamnosidase